MIYMRSLKESLPSKYNPKDIEIRNGIVFDNVKGAGSVPWNQQVNYKGFVVYMYPDTFLHLASELVHPDIKDIKYEKGTPIGCPFFTARFDLDENIIEVGGHEGRHRLYGIINSIGKEVLIPVHVFLRGGLNARDLDEQNLIDAKWIREDDSPMSSVYGDEMVYYLKGDRVD